jgi:hypothetical protein
MTATERLQQRLEQLPPDQREAMAEQILAEWEALAWDRQIEADAGAGKLDRLIQQAKEHHRAGRTTRLS